MAPLPERTIDGTAYIHTLAAYVRRHEDKLADFVRRKPPATAPSWTTILTMGVLSSDVPVAPKPPLILRFDPHHLYYLLLKFDEAGVGGSGGIGNLDVVIDGGPSRPMTINYSGLDLPSTGILGINSDAASFQSTFSAVSTFSLGSGWWGASAPVPDVTVDVKYLYSSCTKLPAIRLVPFTFSSSQPPSSAALSGLNKPVKDFEDCPPPNTAVPLYAFKNLLSLILEDLDPRGFLGWDVLCMQLRSLEVHGSGMEDVGELLCDAVVEDAERRKKGRGGVGEERRRRQGLSLDSDPASAVASDPSAPLEPSLYPVPPPAAWSRLRHLSLSSNSLTFVPASPLVHLSCLTSLDLSSNLLIAVPPGLAHLHSLRSLDLSDNMIESLFGISKALGNVTVVNLSKNRIDNLSGLDRLFALERIDLRENWVRESLEVSRLASLPCLVEVWIEGNLFCRPVAEGGEESYRTKLFSYFAREGREAVLIDGTAPGLSERRGIEQLREASRAEGGRRGSLGSTSRRSEEAATASQAKIVGRRVVTTPHPSHLMMPPSNGTVSEPMPQSTLPLPATGSPPPDTPTRPAKGTPRRRKPHRIVNLDGTGPSASTVAASSTTGGELSGQDFGEPSDSDKTSSPHFVPIRARKSQAEDDRDVSKREFGHVRFPTSPTESSETLEQRLVEDGTASVGVSSSSKQTRRNRMSASTFESPSSSEDAFGPRQKAAETSADAFRKKIEALRSEVGDSWLSVLGERERAAERSKSQSDDSGTDGTSKQATSTGGDVAASPPQQEAVPVVKVIKGKKKRKGKAT